MAHQQDRLAGGVRIPRAEEDISDRVTREGLDLRPGVLELLRDVGSERVYGLFITGGRFADDKFFEQIDNFIVVFAEKVEQILVS